MIHNSEDFNLVTKGIAFEAGVYSTIQKLVKEAYLEGYKQAMFDSVEVEEQHLYLHLYAKVQKQLKANLEKMKEF